ncbi:hypothetical protein [Dactylosporangium sp. NPDC000521]|uniref:hypothetical protein n=1 Tax=Dactylosporangium sp. NPDC000521 TaxID=3363975 RepID=UPI003680E2E8
MPMVAVTIYHNVEGRFEPYQEGQPLLLVLSYRLACGAELGPQGVAEDAFQFFNADLEFLEPRRGGDDREVLFLAACVYRLLGCRSLSVGDVIHVRNDTDGPDGTADVWLACDRNEWRPIAEPFSRSGPRGTAAAVYERLTALRASA